MATPYKTQTQKFVRSSVDETAHRTRNKTVPPLSWSSPGPLAAKGLPHEKYISEILPDEAARLLQELDIQVPALAFPGRPHENWSSWSGATDEEVLASIRQEQAARAQFEVVAMLVCLLGCDALFERGYLVVGEQCELVPGRETASEVLRAAVERRTGTAAPPVPSLGLAR